MVDYRRHLATSAVLALVLLRLVIGWHFFSEGTSKVEYDPMTGGYRVGFSAEGFLKQAKGPLAGLYLAPVSETHDWPTLLAVPRANRPLHQEEIDKRAAWAADYNRRRADAEKAKQPLPVEFPPHAPYHDWARKIVDDWKSVLADVTALPGLTEAQQRKAAEAFELRRQQLADYLAGETTAIVDYQNELARLERWKNSPEADGVPFQEDRIAAKTAETAATPKPWINQVGEFEQNYLLSLRHILTSEQQANATMVSAMDSALAEPGATRMSWINLGATILTLGVGICLIAGLFTRAAAIVGALFLLSVVASQPFWVSGAQSTIYQIIELVALLVLAATAAGRWFGLDYVTWMLFHRNHESEV